MHCKSTGQDRVKVNVPRGMVLTAKRQREKLAGSNFGRSCTLSSVVQIMSETKEVVFASSICSSSRRDSGVSM